VISWQFTGQGSAIHGHGSGPLRDRASVSQDDGRLRGTALRPARRPFARRHLAAEETLNQTTWTQPALSLHLALADLLELIVPSVVLGHSVGQLQHRAWPVA